MHAFDHPAPEIKYIQDEKNTCILSSMDYAFFSLNEHVA